MTGTADTEAFEFRQIYGLDVVVIPTHRPIARKDFNDLVYLTQEEKYAAIITDIKQCQALGRPILVGTASIESSEYVSKLLQRQASSTRCSTPSTTRRKPRSSPRLARPVR